MRKLLYRDFRGANGHRRFGELFADSIKEMSKERLLPNSLKRAREKSEKRYGAYCDELRERALGAGVDPELYFAALLYYKDEDEHCTDVILVRPDGNIAFGHNEDGEYTESNSVLASYSGITTDFTEFSSAGYTPGYTFMWNTKGLITSVNYIGMEKTLPEEIPAGFLLRDTVEAGSIDEIREKLAGVCCSTGFSLNVVDTNLGRAYSVEHRYDETSIVQVGGRFVHANHFLRLGHGYINPESNTLTRFESARRIVDALDPRSLDSAGVMAALGYLDEDADYSVLALGTSKRDSITAATMLYDSERPSEVRVLDRLSGELSVFTR